MIRPKHVLALLLTCAVLCSCSSGSALPTTVAASAGPVTSEAPVSYPLTLESEFGKVTIPKQPKRVVALGGGDADAVLALGVNPVGLIDWDQVGGPGVGPWVTKEIPAEPETVFDMWPWRTGEKLPFAQIENLKPDLILWTDSELAMDRKPYQKMSRIAPTVAALTGKDKPAGDYLERQTRQVALVLGKVAEGEELLADLNTKFNQLRAKYPQFKGATLTMADYDGFGLSVPVKGSPGFSPFERLGFTTSPALQKLDTADRFPKDGYVYLDMTWLMPPRAPSWTSLRWMPIWSCSIRSRRVRTPTGSRRAPHSGICPLPRPGTPSSSAVTPTRPSPWPCARPASCPRPGRSTFWLPRWPRPWPDSVLRQLHDRGQGVVTGVGLPHRNYPLLVGAVRKNGAYRVLNLFGFGPFGAQIDPDPAVGNSRGHRRFVFGRTGNDQRAPGRQRNLHTAVAAVRDQDVGVRKQLVERHEALHRALAGTVIPSVSRPPSAATTSTSSSAKAVSVGWTRALTSWLDSVPCETTTTLREPSSSHHCGGVQSSIEVIGSGPT